MGREPTLSSMITRAAGMAAGTAMGLALAIGVTSTAVPTQQAEAASYPRADYRPGTDLEPYCQWSAERHHKVLVIGKHVKRAKVKLTGGRTVTAKPKPQRIAKRLTLVWVKVPSRYQEDDIRKVSAKIGKKWRVCEPS